MAGHRRRGGAAGGQGVVGARGWCACAARKRRARPAAGRCASGRRRRWRAARRRSSASGRRPRCRRWRGCTRWPPRTSSTRTGWAGHAPTREVGPTTRVVGRRGDGQIRRARRRCSRPSRTGSCSRWRRSAVPTGWWRVAVSRLVTIAERPRPTRSRCARGVLDAPFRRIPGRRTRIRVRHSRRTDGVVDPAVRARCGPVRGRRWRSPRLPPSSEPSKVKAGDVPKLVRLAAR